MSVGRYMAEHTDLQHAAFIAWLRLHRFTDMEWRDPADDPPNLSMDGCVPPETQERWMGKHQGAKFAILAQVQKPPQELTPEERANREREVRARFAMARVTFAEEVKKSE